MRNKINEELRAAEDSSNSAKQATLRLILTAIDDQDKKVRARSANEGISDDAILDIVKTMIRQRERSSRNYEEQGRFDQSDKEIRELQVLKELLPSKLCCEDVNRAIKFAIKKTGASTIRHKGHVMCELKSRYAGRMDFQKVGKQVEELLLG